MPTSVADLPVVDPHFHLWDLEHHSYPWLTTLPLSSGICGDISPIARSYLIEDYRADQVRWHISACVHVQADYDPSAPVAETRWLQGVADRDTMPDGIVAAATLEDPDVERVLAQHAQFPNVRGIRQSVNWHPDPAKTVLDRADLMLDSRWLSGFRLLQKYGLSFDLQLYPSQLKDAVRLAARNPSIPIILNHAGMPIDRDENNLSLWRSGMKALATQPNVSVKISGLGMTDWHWTTASIRPFVLDTIGYFGVDRCMFASNFPVDKLYSTFDELYDAYDEIVRDFTAEERRRLFGSNAAQVYRLKQDRP